MNSDVCTAINASILSLVCGLFTQHSDALTNQNHITKINPNLAASVSVRVVIIFKYF
jgi:hypothetical protein